MSAQDRLYKENRSIAPRNRTLFLTRKDRNKYGKVSLLRGLRSLASLAEAMDNIYNCDCLEAFPLIPSSSIDLVFADPPYNLGKDFGNDSDRMPEDEYLEWTSKWVKEGARVLKPTGALYVCCDWRYSGALQSIIAKHLTIKNRITWRREKGRGSRKNWKSNMEDIWFAVAGESYVFNLDEVKIKKQVIAPYRENGRPKDWAETDNGRYRYTCPSNIWIDTVVPFWSMRENTPHPTQKPEMLLERILKASTDLGAIVLDPFMGSGTTAAVARRLGRHFIGFELNPEYVQLALKRLDLRVRPSQKEMF